MELIKKEIELDEKVGYEYRVALPMRIEMKASRFPSDPSRIAPQAVAVYKYVFYNPYHKTYVYKFEGIDIL